MRTARAKGTGPDLEELVRERDAKSGRLLDVESRLADLPGNLEKARQAAAKAVASGKDAAAAQRRVARLGAEQESLEGAKTLLTEEIGALEREIQAATAREARDRLRRLDGHMRGTQTHMHTLATAFYRESWLPMAEQYEGDRSQLIAAAHASTPNGTASSTMLGNVANRGVRLRELSEALDRFVKNPDGPGTGILAADARQLVSRDRPPRERPTGLAFR